MTATLLDLPDGHLSLEFETADVPAVRALIRDRYGPPDVEQGVALSVLRFGGAEFVFQNEWDDPCLIASTIEGDRILRELLEGLEADS